jgi:hypothetical protein
MHPSSIILQIVIPTLRCSESSTSRSAPHPFISALVYLGSNLDCQHFLARTPPHLSFFSTTTQGGSGTHLLLLSPDFTSFHFSPSLDLLLLFFPICRLQSLSSWSCRLPSISSLQPVPTKSPRGQFLTFVLEDVVYCTEPARQSRQIRGDSCGHHL